MEITNYKSYNGNPNLKRSGVQVNWTPEMVKEYARCAADPIYFAENYVKIINVNDGLINFKPYLYQRKMIKSMHEQRNTIIATARQAGKCFCINTPIRIRNKKTGQILETTIGEFYEMQSMRQTIQSKT